MAAFKQNLVDFCHSMDVSTLTPHSAELLGHGLQAALAQAGVAGYRAFLMGHETHMDVVLAEGEAFRFNAVRDKRFLTPFGEMELPRRCYQNKSDTRSHVPLDAAWGMEGQYMSPQVREAVLFSCAHITPEETAALLRKCALFTPHPTAIKHVVEGTGTLVETNRDLVDIAVRAQEIAPENTQALVASLDGVTVLLNESGTRFGRRAERPRGEEPLQTPTAYRVAMVGSVSHYGGAQTHGAPLERLQSRYVSHMPEPRCPTFKSRFEAELDAAEAHAPPGTPCILLLDGAREMWKYLDTNPRFDHYHRCIDFWHAVEHLSVAAEALFPHDPKAAKQWYERYYETLLQTDDGAARIRRSIDYYQNKHKRSKTSQKHLNEQRTYFKRNGRRMPYATFRAHGWPIGSGPIEAACKTLVKTRLCRSGMRWTRAGGQRILTLRTYVKSNRWEAAWNEIKALRKAA